MAEHARGAEIRKFITRHVEAHPSDIATVTANKFEINERAVNFHLKRLSSDNILEAKGNTRSRIYSLKVLAEWNHVYEIAPGLTEDLAWDEILPIMGDLPKNVLSIWNTGFTEMFNNALEHSGGTEISVSVQQTAVNTELEISDNGVGIFKKIQLALNLTDERHAILELSKGKLTTNPEKHSGQRIFFTSRMFDSFDILSGGLFFTQDRDTKTNLLLQRDRFKSGTAVWMKIANDSDRDEEKIYREYGGPEHDFAFAKTVVPVRLAQYGGDKLVSRSQAKMVLAGLEKFQIVSFNFTGVETIGPAFADEIFRVFATAHPEMQIGYTNANAYVTGMIQRAAPAGEKS
jgi:anti-sigma regulatory factor (Ser/Thr protein kinase)